MDARFGITTIEYGREFRAGGSVDVFQGGTMNFEFVGKAQRLESLLKERI